MHKLCSFFFCLFVAILSTTLLFCLKFHHCTNVLPRIVFKRDDTSQTCSFENFVMQENKQNQAGYDIIH